MVNINKILTFVFINLLCSLSLSQTIKPMEFNHPKIKPNEVDHAKNYLERNKPFFDSNYIQNTILKETVNHTVLENGSLLIEKLKQSYDGTGLINESRESYTYDESNLENEFYSEKWIDNEWIYDLKRASIYDDMHKVVQQTYWKYDSGPLVAYPWYDYLNDTYKYDQNNNLVEWIRKTSYGSNWINLFKYIYRYNKNNLIVEKLYLRWEESDWNNNKRETYLYDELGNEIEYLAQKWNGSNWDYEWAIENSYNENLIIQSIHYIYEEIGWIKNQKEIYTYNSDDKVEEYIRQKWQNDNWVNDLKREYEYFYYETSTTEIMYLLFPSQTGWEYIQKIISYINKVKGPIEIISHYPIIENSELFWGWDNRYLFIYDQESNLIKQKYQDWDNSLSSWQTLELNSFKYTTLTDLKQNIDLLNKIKLSNNYPNPFNPSTTINYSIPKQSNVKLKVFDLSGSEVKTLVNKAQSQGNYEVEFDGDELTSGIYFYRLQADDFIETKKMMLLK